MAYKMGGFGAKSGHKDTVLSKKDGQGPREKDKGPVENRIYVSNNNKVGGYVSEDEFESKFAKKKGDASTFPQTSVQDYSKVKSDSKGKYVVKLS